MAIGTKIFLERPISCSHQKIFLSPTAPVLLSCFLADNPRRTGPVPVAPGRLQLPYPIKYVQRFAKAVWEGSREHRRRNIRLVQDSQGILRPFPLSNNLPSDRVVSEDTGDGGGGSISSSIWQPPLPLRPPRGLLPEPRQARSREFLAPTTRRWAGGFLQRHPTSRYLKSPSDPRSTTSRQAASRRYIYIE